jgi:hypothetical protein
MGSDGPQNEITAVNIETGSVIKKFLLDVTREGDWESMSLGPCNSINLTKTCLYIGNMGNNVAHSCTNKYCTKGNALVYIYKLEEPNINANYSGSSIKVSTLKINYSAGNFPTNRADSESLFVVRHF